MEEYGVSGAPGGAYRTVSQGAIEQRLTFIQRTYAHLFGAIGVFAVLCFLFLQLEATWQFWAGVPNAEALRAMGVMGGVLGTGGIGWLVVLGAFVIGGMVAQKLARNTGSRALQYAGLAFYTLIEAVIFSPMLMLAEAQANGAIGSAAIVTMIMFAGLTVFVFMTKKDFSFMRGMLVVGGLVAIGVIVVSAIFGMSLGIWFSAAMVLLAGGSILYDTSNIMHHYDTDQYVGAALDLFASVALLFWYILRIFMSKD